MIVILDFKYLKSNSVLLDGTEVFLADNGVCRKAVFHNGSFTSDGAVIPCNWVKNIDGIMSEYFVVNITGSMCLVSPNIVFVCSAEDCLISHAWFWYNNVLLEYRGIKVMPVINNNMPSFVKFGSSDYKAFQGVSYDTVLEGLRG